MATLAASAVYVDSKSGALTLDVRQGEGFAYGLPFRNKATKAPVDISRWAFDIPQQQLKMGEVSGGTVTIAGDGSQSVGTLTVAPSNQMGRYNLVIPEDLYVHEIEPNAILLPIIIAMIRIRLSASETRLVPVQTVIRYGKEG